MSTSLRAPESRIAIVRLSHLGDIVLTLPLFHALRGAFPGARIAWVAQAEFAPLLEGLPGLEHVIRFERRGGAQAWLRLREDLARFAPELAIDAQGNLKSGFALLASGAQRRVGPARADYRERWGAFAATEHAAAVDGTSEHAMERTLALCRHVAGHTEVRRDPASTAVELAGAEREFAARVGADAAVLLQLSPARDVRSWPVQRCAELVLACARQGRRVLALSGPSEAREGLELQARLGEQPGVQHWIAQRGLRELAAFFSVAARHGAQYVGCDTGPTHLAAACGLPVTVLCGPHSHLRTGPWPVARPAPLEVGPHRAVRAAAQPACAPCFARKCRNAEGAVCMSALAVDDVRMALAARSSP
ncbi:MAG: glycosyltransferase family 9 protein [Planctomycetes bacterium]|nr:glycosyltransferase family 9 protein [Planctomycetota bacterium]